MGYETRRDELSRPPIAMRTLLWETGGHRWDGSQKWSSAAAMR